MWWFESTACGSEVCPGSRRKPRSAPERALETSPGFPIDRFTHSPSWVSLRHALFALLLLLCLRAGAAIQFDVFPGYDGVVPEANWFPILFEIKNDGPSFSGAVEVTAENMN